ncbi:MAG: ferrous iron transport protein B [Prevotellaceae bacterium]|jgi:ferrous iron transport protein B|nr:ferrous iron transport protein B [Prevotellaceae bacterium]
MRLSDLKTGDKAVVVKVLGHGGFRKRIIEMGFVRGKTVEVLLNAPLRDPIKYKVMDYEVSLRRNEAQKIEVVSLEEAQNGNATDNPFHGTLYEDCMHSVAMQKRKTINVALVGNPNAGKTSLFNVASGAQERVGNYSGVTVERKDGHFQHRGYRINIVDLPGTYSLSAYSPEETYVRKHIAENLPDVIINVIDASNIERNMFLTTQLIDMNVPMVIALNMYDELEASGAKIDYVMLGKLLGVPVVPTNSKKGLGTDSLFDMVIRIYEQIDLFDHQGNIRKEVFQEIHDLHHKHNIEHSALDELGGKKGKKGKKNKDVEQLVRHIHINHGEEIESGINALREKLWQQHSLGDKYTTRYLAIKLLEGDKAIEQYIISLKDGNEILALRDREAKRISEELQEDIESAITNAKYGFIAGALRETMTEPQRDLQKITKAIDEVVTNRYLGFPVFLFIMWLMFESTFVLGAYPMGWIESFVSWFGGAVGNLMNEGPVKDLIVDGIIAGVGGVIVFLPNILILYFFISLMEGTGYMARAAFIMDKIMHKIGLHGKSFIPLIMGFGCNVPAIMAARTLENHNSRMITILITPLVTCSARLPVYLLLAAAFFPEHGSLMLLGIYAASMLTVILMAKLFKTVLFNKDEVPFVMELPPYRLPTMKATLRHMWSKASQYLKKMGSIILLASIVIWFLSYYPRTETGQQDSYLVQMGQFIEPAIKPLGFNGNIGIALISGVAAKEIVVSTLNIIYTGEDTGGNENLLIKRMKADAYEDGKPVFTPLVALSLILFVLLYFPCVAAITAVKNETGSWRWAFFVMGYTLALAWTVSFIVFQTGRLCGL